MVKKSFLLTSLFAFCISLYSLFPLFTTVVQAAKCNSEDKLTFISIKPWYSGVCKAGTDDVEITSIPGDFVVIGLNFLTIAFQLAGYAAVGLVIWGGIKYILANGDSGKITAAKSTIQNALIGLLVVLAAVTIVDFVIDLYG